MQVILHRNDFGTKTEGYHLDAFEDTLLNAIGVSSQVAARADEITIYIDGVVVLDSHGNKIHEQHDLRK